jgi:ABC-type multidrug transport system fused ATPase/permease subunit
MLGVPLPAVAAATGSERGAPPLAAIWTTASLAAVFKRGGEWTREVPWLIGGLYELAKPLRWHLAVVFGLNVCIAAWETIQPMIFAWGVDTFEAKVPYLQMAAIVVFPVLALSVPHGILLPFLRDLYQVWFVKPRFERHVGLLCLSRDRSHARSLDPELKGRKAPIIQEGRDAAYGLIDMLIRDPAFALRGLVVLGVLYFMSPILVSLLFLGIVADLFVTLLMDARLFRPYALQQEHMFRIRGIEYQLLDGVEAAEGSLQKRADLRHYEEEWDRYVRATRYAELRRLIYQLPVRETISLIVRIGSMLLVAWWVHTGEVSIGQYIFFVQLAGRANDPLYVFLGLQQKIMTTRESLRRLGLLTGIDFGIARPTGLARA